MSRYRRKWRRNTRGYTYENFVNGLRKCFEERHLTAGLDPTSSLESESRFLAKSPHRATQNFVGELKHAIFDPPTTQPMQKLLFLCMRNHDQLEELVNNVFGDVPKDTLKTEAWETGTQFTYVRYMVPRKKEKEEGEYPHFDVGQDGTLFSLVQGRLKAHDSIEKKIQVTEETTTGIRYARDWLDDVLGIKIVIGPTLLPTQHGKESYPLIKKQRNLSLEKIPDAIFGEQGICFIYSKLGYRLVKVNTHSPRGQDPLREQVFALVARLAIDAGLDPLTIHERGSRGKTYEAIHLVFARDSPDKNLQDRFEIQLVTGDMEYNNTIGDASHKRYKDTNKGIPLERIKPRGCILVGDYNTTKSVIQIRVIHATCDQIEATLRFYEYPMSPFTGIGAEFWDDPIYFTHYPPLHAQNFKKQLRILENEAREVLGKTPHTEWGTGCDNDTITITRIAQPQFGRHAFEYDLTYSIPLPHSILKQPHYRAFYIDIVRAQLENLDRQIQKEEGIEQLFLSEARAYKPAQEHSRGTGTPSKPVIPTIVHQGLPNERPYAVNHTQQAVIDMILDFRNGNKTMERGKLYAQWTETAQNLIAGLETDLMYHGKPHYNDTLFAISLLKEIVCKETNPFT